MNRVAREAGGATSRLRDALRFLRYSPPGRFAWGVLRRSRMVTGLVERYALPPEASPDFTARQEALWKLEDLCDPARQEAVPATGDEAFLVSVLTPAYNTAPRFLRELFQTLLNQQYPNWEWVVADDGSSDPATRETLRELAAADARVRLILNPLNQGISAASNAALGAATGNFVALVDHDDLLARDALLRIYEAWRDAPGAQLFYTDECKLMPDGQLKSFWPKPDWSPAYLENTMCIGHLSVYKTEFLRGLGGFRSAFDGTQDYDLALRAALAGPAVRHLPVFAYLWRVIPGSAATNLEEKGYAVERQRKAVLDYARYKQADAQVVPGFMAGYWRINYAMPAPCPKLSFVIMAGGGSGRIRGRPVDLALNCIRGFEEKNFYPNREYIVVHNGNLTDAQTCALAAMPGVVLLHYDKALFNLSEKLNFGVARATGDYICLVHDDVEALTPKGGEALISYLHANPQTGAIGPLSLRADGTVRQNGIVLLPAAGPVNAANRQRRGFSGHQEMLRCRRETFAIGGAMLVTRKTLFDQLGGFSEDLALHYNDVDFCVRLRAQGYRCVIDPEIAVYHFATAAKIENGAAGLQLLRARHPGLADPYFNKWFDPGNPNYVLRLERITG
jgi:glycosyltransferase involved in cell wall biosynthesis